MEYSPEPVPSPCIRNCCLDYNDICLGCFRSINEIMQWGSANNQMRHYILLQTQERRRLHGEVNNDSISADNT
jgi:predicted Fe-S protein YdhL (DUF1289 family)